MLPGFGTELRQALEAADRRDLATQIPLLVLENYRYDAARQCTALKFAPQQRVSGQVLAANGETVDVPHRRSVEVATDKAGHIHSITLGCGTDVAEALHAFSPLRQ